jgi:L-asparaginase
MMSKILLVYTGGTIGMIKDSSTGALRAFDFDKLLVHIPELRQIDCDIHTVSFKEPIDSSDMDIKAWQKLGDLIHDRYHEYDGFVVLHGSDTMAYTGSALSFMFDGLTKPIILTGSQLPIGDLRTDAKENLITSIQLASITDNNTPAIKEVCIYFEYQLYRANRTSKLNAEHFEAFSSPNYPPLAISGVHLNIDRSLLWNASTPFKYRRLLSDGVAILKLFPGITRDVVTAICGIKGLRGLIIETYGSGNALTESWFIQEIQQTVDRGVEVINVTQCKGGAVVMGKYATSVELKKIGVVSGKDMTIEAALAKLMYLLSHLEDRSLFKEYFESSLRGEVTP